MSATVLSVGLAGELPAGHPHAALAARAADPAALEPLVLSPTLRRERKVRVLVEAAQRALAAPLAARPGARDRCALVVVSRRDGRPASFVDRDTSALVSFADMEPSTVAYAFVPHMAASCIPHLFRLRGPSVSLGSREGLAAAWRVGERWLGRRADVALLIETELGLPSCVRSDPPVPSDYALAVLIGKEEHTS